MQRLMLVFTFCFLAAPVSLAADYYSVGGWSTLHRDAGNRRSAEGSVVGRDYQTWHRLSNASTLTIPTVSPDGNSLYVTTGLAAGERNLHAFTIDGELLWQAAPWQNTNDSVDACAILSSPVIDDQGDIYINDCNQMWAFKPDGQLKWVVALPPVQPGDWVAAGDHPVNAVTTAAFTAAGDLLGVTNFGDIVIFDRSTGAVLNKPYRLPGLIPPSSDLVPLPDSLLGNDFMDPQFREWTWQLIFGGNMRSANTPAIAANGRLFVMATATTAGRGALYAMDLVMTEGGIELQQAFATEVGPGSGSSPALSPAADSVYVSDEEGWLYSVDAVNGELQWRVKTHAAAGAAAVGDDGTVYALQQHAPAVIAVTADGKIAWESDSSALSQAYPSSWLLGEPAAIGNGNPTVTADAVVVPVVYGYHLELLGRIIPLPVASTLVALDLKTGKAIENVIKLPDDSSGITAVLANGTIINSLGGVMSSSVKPLQTIINWLLPGELQLLEPIGGIQVSRPSEP